MKKRGRQGSVTSATAQVACAACGLKPFCTASPPGSANAPCAPRRRLRAGEVLYAQGEPAAALYAVRAGFFKSCVSAASGEPRVVAFHLMGDVLGLDALGGAMHRSTAVALGDGEVCRLALTEAERLMSDHAALAAGLRARMGAQLADAGERMVALCAMPASERVAAHLLEVSRRWAERGYSPSEFGLCMSRKDTGSYLGLTLESVSRTLSQFAASGWIALAGRSVKILDRAALEAQVAGE